MPNPRKLTSVSSRKIGKADVIRKTWAEDAAQIDPITKRPPKECIDEVAKQEWKRAYDIIEQTGGLTYIDRNALVTYCNVWSCYIKACDQMKESGYLMMGLNGSMSPFANALLKYSQEVRAAANACGLSLESRLKIGDKKAQIIESSIESQFGAI